MCLRVTSSNLDSIKWDKNDSIIAYKVLRRNIKKEKKLFGMYLSKFMYKPGLNTPTKLRKRYNTKIGSTIEKGALHVCLTKARALYHALYAFNVVIVPVICYKQDFIARGLSEAVFKAIHIDRDLYNRAIKSTNKDSLIRKR